MPPTERGRKTCMVPYCKADSTVLQDRILFTVPEAKKRRWLEIVGQHSDSIDPKERLFCCENHFSTKRDIVGYHFYKAFGGRIKLEDHAYPCKNLGEKKFTPPTRIPIITTEPTKLQEVDEPGVDDPLDPLATANDFEDGDDSDRDGMDTGFGHVSDDDDEEEEEEANFDQSKDLPVLSLSEEIVVTSDVYPMDDGDDFSDSDDFPLKAAVKTEKKSTNSDAASTKKPKVDQTDEEADSNSSRYNCSQCPKKLSSSRSLKRHSKTFLMDQKPRTISCTECSETFLTRDDLVKHKTVHKKVIECDVCEKTFKTRFLLKSHYVQHLNEKPFLCEICSRPFARMATLQKHRFTHVTEKTHMCEECGKAFSANFLLKQHVHQYHTKNTTVMCASCSKTFSSTALLNIHIKAYHDEVNPYECAICLMHFKHPSALLRHRKRFNDPRSSFPCELCPKKFSKVEMLERHMKTHPNRPISLDSKFRLKDKVHKPVEKQVFKCDECGITLCRPDRLRAHLASLHNPKFPHRCVTCRQTFPTEILLTQHAMRLHAPEHEYIYKCHICPKKYNQEAALKRHVKLHTDPKKPVRCELCGKVLGRPNRLKPLMRALHNPDNPHKCLVCFQTFREQKMLDSHNTQMHEQTILCQYCAKSFGKHEGLLQHIRRNHSDPTSIGKEIKLESDE